jgi:hypothetical protein
MESVKTAMTVCKHETVTLVCTEVDEFGRVRYVYRCNACWYEFSVYP